MIPSTTFPNQNYINGIFRIGSQRNINLPISTDHFFLTCNRFWQSEILFTSFTEEGANVLETFTSLNNENFLKKVQNKFLDIELSKSNVETQHKVVGLLRLPLHQFYIAYRDVSLTNRLKNDRLPVISTDAWVPIVSPVCGNIIGEVECLLAMGTQKQIENLQNSRAWKTDKIFSPTISTSVEDDLAYSNRNPIPSNETDKYNFQGKIAASLNTPNPGEFPENPKNNKKPDILIELKNTLKSETPVLNSLRRVNHAKERHLLGESFKMSLEILNARSLPPYQTPKLKKKLSRSAVPKGRHLRLPAGEEPNTYVTFQADESNGHIVKSHEGMVYSTPVVQKSCNPFWNVTFLMSVSLSYFFNKTDRFVLKIWKKNNKSTLNDRGSPSPMEDTIIGFAAVDLTPFATNVPFICDWFNILDFSGNITGQIKVTLRPMEDVKKLINLVRLGQDTQVENLLDTFESSLDITNINLSRAIKRKFTELEEISQRLRTRLLSVTCSVDTGPLVCEISDEQLDEFENDLNTVACEEENNVENFSSLICFPKPK